MRRTPLTTTPRRQRRGSEYVARPTDPDELAGARLDDAQLVVLAGDGDP